MSLGRVLMEPFQADVVDWLKERVDVVIVDSWLELERWRGEATQCDAVISGKGQIRREEIEASKGRMKIISRVGVGVDPSRVDLDAARQHRVWVTNQPGSNSVSVAELVFGQMITLVRNTIAANEAVRNGRWSDYLKFVGTELAGKTIGIIGMGNIGTRVALRARAFEMDFLVYDPYVHESHVNALRGRSVGLDELLAESDFVTVHCPFTPETRNMLAARELGLMKKTAYLINAARGGIVDEADLYDVLSRHDIAGAAIDVVADEPPPDDHPLFKLENIVFTPHLGAVTTEARSRGEIGAAEEVIRVLEGKRPKNPVFELE